MIINSLQPVQLRMLELLCDGQPHSRKELHGCLYDEMGPQRNILSHLSRIRCWLRPRGMDILIQYVRNSVHYRLVRTCVNLSLNTLLNGEQSVYTLPVAEV